MSNLKMSPAVESEEVKAAAPKAVAPKPPVPAPVAPKPAPKPIVATAQPKAVHHEGK